MLSNADFCQVKVKGGGRWGGSVQHPAIEINCWSEQGGQRRNRRAGAGIRAIQDLGMRVRLRVRVRMRRGMRMQTGDNQKASAWWC